MQSATGLQGHSNLLPLAHNAIMGLSVKNVLEAASLTRPSRMHRLKYPPFVIIYTKKGAVVRRADVKALRFEVTK